MSKNKKQKMKNGPNRKKQRTGWKILFRYLFEYKKSVILLSVLGVVSALANGTVPYIIGKFFDAVLEPSALVFIGTQIEMPMWAFLIGIFATVQIVADVVDWVNRSKMQYIGINLFSNYKANSFKKLIRLPISFHASKKKGEFGEAIQQAASALTGTSYMIITLAPQFLSVVIGVSIVMWLNTLLGFVLITGVIIYILLLVNTVKPLADFITKGNKAWKKAGGVVFDAMENIHSVKSFTSEKNAEKKFFRDYSSGATQWHKVQLIWTKLSFLQSFVVTITRVTIFIVSVALIKNNTISIGELIAFNGYAGMVFGPFVRLSTDWQRIQKDVGVIEDTEKMLNTPPEIYEPKNSVDMGEIRGNVEFKNVFFHYKKKDGDVLKGVEVSVKAGEVVALVGESGVGKSTFIELISGYYFAQKGRVLVDGVDVRKIRLAELRGAIAVVPQEVALFNDTVLANIKYGSFKASEKEVREAAQRAHADVFIEKFPKKYKQVVGERGIKLSVGQKQRIAIARAILRDPKILILDEPTSALDAQTERFITESLDKLMKGRTTFITAHRLSTVRKADKILVFKAGKIVESGKHEELLAKEYGVYKRLYDLQIGLS